MKSPQNKRIFEIIAILVLVALASVTAVLGWFVYDYIKDEFDMGTGKLTPEFAISVWRGDETQGEWQDVETTDTQSATTLDFGSMDNISVLPEDSGVLMRMKVSESVDQTMMYDYLVKLSEIKIKIGGMVSGQFVEFLDGEGKVVFPVDYYQADGARNCYAYSAYSGTDADFVTSPYELFSDATPTTITTKNQQLNGELVDMNEYLYVMIVPVLSGLQDIVTHITAEYMPYYLATSLEISGEIRTKD